MVYHGLSISMPRKVSESIYIHLPDFTFQCWGVCFAFLFPRHLPVVTHKAEAEVSKIGNLQERLVVVNHGWQNEATDGSKGD